MNLKLRGSLATERWEAQAGHQCYGVRYGLRSNLRDLLEGLEEFLPPLRSPAALETHDRLYSLVREPAAGPNATYRLYVGSRLRKSAADPADLFDHVEGDLQIHVGEHSELTFIHAGVVAWNGTAIIIPGRSFSGKSTLVTALLQQGATYYSDEFAILDDAGNVYPYPRRLSLREAGRPRTVRRTAESFGRRPGVSPIRPGLVLLTRYRAAAQWAPRPVGRSAAILELVRHSLSIRRQPERVLRALDQLVQRAAVVGGDRGEARETAARILQLDGLRQQPAPAFA